MCSLRKSCTIEIMGLFKLLVTCMIYHEQGMGYEVMIVIRRLLVVQGSKKERRGITWFRLYQVELVWIDYYKRNAL